ncbi:MULTISPECIES: AMP-binding protein [Cupriavidus]|uniref:Long-chain-fatty-acid--CoA ligase n=1 Tax=Cupriavidus oxalaticus TaxID=96344 RepID=A0A4P7L4I6_9BURK|nr:MULTISPECIES: AMP-binding protein [Cupriavidus]MBF6990142.1 AMP-binding protein [Cupriavidus sp. IK-TO18]QBY50416.1 long-chain fatty acid--CoA ligase [Cupriavidus oxalaticus]
MTTKPWLASYGDIPAEIDADTPRSLTALLDTALRQHADRPAFTCLGQTVSYAGLDAQSRDFAAYLQSELGVRKGDRIGVMLPNLIAFPIALIAIARIGAVQVNINPMYTARELEHQLNDAGVEILVAYSGISATVAEVMARTPLRTIVTAGPGDGTGAALPSPPVDPRLAQAIAFDAAVAQGRALPLQAVEIEGNDLIFLQYTGGTTGVSKGAALSHRNLVANVAQFKAMVTDNLVDGKEVVVTAIPLYHIFALMVNFITFFTVGARNWLVPNPRDMDAFIDVLKASRCTVLTGVNTLYAGLVAHPRIGEVDFSSLRLAAGGGAAIVPATSQRWKALTGVFIREGYGLSETSPIVSFNPPTAEAFNGTTGLPLPSTDIRLLGDDDRDVPPGAAGEVCVKGPQVMRGYWNKPGANADAFTADGYFRTGDIGMLTEQGYLKIVDRKKDMVIVSGFNVFPNEIEAVVSDCPGVIECACVGISDGHSGEALKVYVVMAAGATLDAAALQAHCRGQLTGYKVPKSFEFVEALPKSTVGKVLRRELRPRA